MTTDEEIRAIEAEVEQGIQRGLLADVPSLPTRPGHIMFANRRGEEITVRAFTLLYEISSYRQVAETFLADGKIRVSTVWLGINHQLLGGEPPLIFETMVFSTELKTRSIPMTNGEPSHEYPYHPAVTGTQDRYTSETQAMEGHVRIVEELQVALEAFGVERILEEET